MEWCLRSYSSTNFWRSSADWQTESSLALVSPTYATAESACWCPTATVYDIDYFAHLSWSLACRSPVYHLSKCQSSTSHSAWCLNYALFHSYLYLYTSFYFTFSNNLHNQFPWTFVFYRLIQNIPFNSFHFHTFIGTNALCGSSRQLISNILCFYW